MSPSLFQVLNISSQDMNSRIADLSNSSNSLANINTTGYKTTRLNFQELLDGATRSGVKSSSSQVMNTQGKLQNTGILSDVAINGEGFFTVTLPDGKPAYTRDGSFLLDENKKLLNGSGYPITFQGTIPPTATEVTIDQNGTIHALVEDAWVTAGTIQLTRFTNPGGLTNIGSNLWSESFNSGKPQTGAPGTINFGILVPGTLESSNVNMADEMTHMIVIQRSFQMASKAFQTTADMIDSAIRLRKV
ncbi:MAG: flagellar basal body rod protein FlgG [Chloroflexi bacterium HGW-Chloroflexi-4]|nr:MAG: flagellar basal body rod protein FlgG [Chloroflexi bacterium HGW-Chloroflexi-4]